MFKIWHPPVYRIWSAWCCNRVGNTESSTLWTLGQNLSKMHQSDICDRCGCTLLIYVLIPTTYRQQYNREAEKVRANVVNHLLAFKFYTAKSRMTDVWGRHQSAENKRESNIRPNRCSTLEVEWKGLLVRWDVASWIFCGTMFTETTLSLEISIVR